MHGMRGGFYGHSHGQQPMGMGLVPAPMMFFAMLFGVMVGLMIGRAREMGMCGMGETGEDWMWRKKMMHHHHHHHHGFGMHECECGEGEHEGPGPRGGSPESMEP